MLPRLHVCLAAFACLFSLPAIAATRNVLPGQLIQAAIDSASTGDTIVVAPGTYPEHLDFKGKAITVTSDPAIPAANTTTFIDGTSSGPVATFSSGEGRGSILTGFTIQNGGSTNVAVTPSAGIYIYNATPTISNNIIKNNICTAIYADSSAPLIQGNDITSNLSSFSTNCDGGSTGGGITLTGYFRDPSFTASVIGNTIENNQAIGTGAGGISLTSAEGAVIQNNIIRNNSGGAAGGISCSRTTKITIFQNLIHSNQESASGSPTAGGLVFQSATANIGPSTAIIASNTIANNTSAPGIAVDAAQVSLLGDLTQTMLINNIVTGNSAAYPSIKFNQNINTGRPPLIIDHNDIYNSGGVAYCTACTGVAGQFGNISFDPTFVSATDYHLQAGSKAVDVGNNSAPGLVAVSNDLGGSPRIQDGSALGYPIVDMGAYEYSGPQDGTPTVLVLTPSTYTPFTDGNPFTLTAKISSSAGTPTGTVDFYEDNGTQKIGSGVLDASGSVTYSSFTASQVAPGVHSFYAKYSSQNGFPPSQSVGLNILFLAATPTITLDSSKNPSVVGDQVTFTATIKSPDGANLPVTISDTYNGTTTTFTPLVNTGVGTYTYLASGLGQGTHNLVAKFDGDATHAAAVPATLKQLVNSGNPTTTTASVVIPPSTSVTANQNIPYGTAIRVGASVSPNVNTGSVTFSSAGTAAVMQSISNGSVLGVAYNSLPTGTYQFNAAYTDASGGTNAPSSGNSVPFNIVAVKPAVLLQVVPSPNAYIGQKISLTAIITNPSTAVVPQGTVTFRYDGIVIGTSPTQTTGTQAVATTSTLNIPSGTHTLTAEFVPSDSSFTGNTSSGVQETVGAIPATPSINATPNPDPVQSPVVVVISVGTPSDTTAPLGSVSLTDTVDGNTRVVGTFALAPIPGKTQSAVELPQTFYTIGRHTLVATYLPANASFVAVRTDTFILDVYNADFTIKTSVNPVSIQTEHHQSLDVTLTSLGNFTASMNILCAALPQYASCNFANTTVPLPANGTVTTSLTIDTDAVLGFKASAEPTHRFGAMAERISLAILLPLSLAGFTRKRRKLGTVILIAVFAVATLGLTACGSKYPGHTTPGTYTVPIIATGTMQTTGLTITRVFNLTLNVTP